MNFYYKPRHSRNWRPFEEWMEFFYHIGIYANNMEEQNIYISYIDSFLQVFLLPMELLIRV